ncbi:MAG TPA: hypothetical protein VKR82_11315 [Candidatus Acidoferrales bacterium]|nr:hypothetical protein [Candidatus Acidoferrales bacterium]
MPVQYKIEKERRLVLSTASGVLTPEDIFAHQRKLAKDPDFDPKFSQLSDFTHVTELDLTQQDVQKIAEATLFAPDARRALVVKDKRAFGLARMFEVLRGDKGDRGIVVFGDYDEGLAWVLSAEPRPRKKQTTWGA